LGVKVVIAKCVVSPHGDALEIQYFDTCLEITNGKKCSISCFKFQIGENMSQKINEKMNFLMMPDGELIKIVKKMSPNNLRLT
jgi:hypothetical protein